MAFKSYLGVSVYRLILTLAINSTKQKTSKNNRFRPNYRPQFNSNCLEVENNAIKSRVGIFVSNNVNYTRMYQLEGINSHIIIIDINDSCTIKRIIIRLSIYMQCAIELPHDRKLISMF